MIGRSLTEHAQNILSALEMIKPCQATLYHGPGHQSRTKCKKKGPHELHWTTYGSYRQEAQWVGNEKCTGFGDEPPDFPDGHPEEV